MDIATESSNEIRQGFLCPICMKDLYDANSLQEHVAVHSTTSEDDPLDYLKGVLGKAKQRILDIDITSSPSTSLVKEVRAPENHRNKAENVSHMDQLKEVQLIGITRSHKDYFMEIRDKCIDNITYQTNTLIIRLDKLINERPEDINRVKEFERDTVPWIDDSNCSICSVCQAKFSLTKRKHHCRLCGAIMCNNCSKFLSFSSAKKLTNPAFAFSEAGAVDLKIKNGLHNRTARRFSINFVNNGSLNLMKNKTERIFSSFVYKYGLDSNTVNAQKDLDESTRICAKCKTLLHAREELLDNLSTPSVFNDLYEKLCQLLMQAINLSPSYRRMATSLNNGESMYTLEAASQLRKRLVAIHREIGDLSERIEQWGLTNDPVAKKPSPRQMTLQVNIRRMALNTLQETLIDLPELPSEEQYASLQKILKTKIRKQIEGESSVVKSSSSNAIFNFHRERSISPKNEQAKASPSMLRSSSSFSGLKNEEGWTPELSDDFHYNPFYEDELPIDPVQQQYIIIKGFLKQAAQAGRLGEVETLEKNLKELEEELRRLDLDIPSDWV